MPKPTLLPRWANIILFAGSPYQISDALLTKANLSREEISDRVGGIVCLHFNLLGSEEKKAELIAAAEDLDLATITPYVDQLIELAATLQAFITEPTFAAKSVLTTAQTEFKQMLEIADISSACQDFFVKAAIKIEDAFADALQSESVSAAISADQARAETAIAAMAPPPKITVTPSAGAST